MSTTRGVQVENSTSTVTTEPRSLGRLVPRSLPLRQRRDGKRSDGIGAGVRRDCRGERTGAQGVGFESGLPLVVDPPVDTASTKL